MMSPNPKQVVQYIRGGPNAGEHSAITTIYLYQMVKKKDNNVYESMQYAYMHSNESNHKNSLLEGLGGYRALKATESINGPQAGSSSTPGLCMTISITS